MARTAALALGVAFAAGPGWALAETPPGFLGVVVDQDGQGRVVAAEVMTGSPAATAGIAAGDVIVSVSGARVRTPQDLVVVVMAAGAGARLRIEIEHAGTARTVDVTLTDRPTGPENPATLEGRPAPPIEARAISPRETANGIATRGRVVVLDFWATWCVPCHMVMPILVDWHRRFCPRGLTVLGVSSESRALVEAFVRRRHIPYAIGLDEGSRTATRYGIGAIPTMVVIDRTGQVRRVNVGADPLELRRTETLIEELLREPAPR